MVLEYVQNCAGRYSNETGDAQFMLSEMEESKKKQKAESFVKDATVSTKDCFNAFGIEEYANTSKHQLSIILN